MPPSSRDPGSMADLQRQIVENLTLTITHRHTAEFDQRHRSHHGLTPVHRSVLASERHTPKAKCACCPLREEDDRSHGPFAVTASVQAGMLPRA